MTTPRGIRNNNPLNIRKGNNWQGERSKQKDPSFEEFESMVMGVRAGFVLLRNYMRGTKMHPKPCVNIAQIIRRWAPPSENATARYINSVSKRSGLNAYEVLSFSEKKKMCALVDAMIWVECGQAIDLAIIESAYDLV